MFDPAERDSGDERASRSPRATGISLSWAQRHPVAAGLQGAVPGVDLAATLDALLPADLDGAALVEAVVAWERVISWATARQVGVVAEMVRRGGAHGGAPEFVADEVAVALAVSRRAGQVLVDRAVGLEDAPRVHDALAAGSLDVRKADALLRETAHLPADVAAVVHGDVLGDAPGLTVPQLRSAVRRAELLVEPTAAEARHARARRERCVLMRPAPDAMAWVSAFLPAEDAMVVMTALDAMAGPAAPGDDRPADAQRADALVQTLREVLDRGCTPDGRATVTRQHRRPHLSITVGAGTLLGLDDAPAYLEGYGLVPAGTARRVARDATWRAVLTDARTGETMARSSGTYRPGAVLARAVVDRDVTCTIPGCRAPAVRCDLDHVVPFDPSRPAAEQTCLGNLQALCRHHHRLKTFGRWVPERDADTGVTTWTTPTGHRYHRDPVPTDPGFPQPGGGSDCGAARGRDPGSAGPDRGGRRASGGGGRASGSGSGDPPGHDGPGKRHPDDGAGTEGRGDDGEATAA